MSFHKDKLAEELEKQCLDLVPDMEKMRFKRNSGHYKDEFYHGISGVTVKVIPIREKSYLSTYVGFKLRLTRGYYSRHTRSVIVIGIDNFTAIRKWVKDSISYKRAKAKSARTEASFKTTLEKTLPRLFPGRKADVYGGSHGDMHISMLSVDNKPSVSIDISPSGQISKIEVSYPGKDLDAVAKLLEAW